MAEKDTDNIVGRIGEVGEETLETGRAVLRAGLGAFAEAEDRGRGVFDTLVARGEVYQRRQQERFEELRRRGGERTQKVREWLDATVDEGTRSLLTRFGVPTREDLARLHRSIDRLTRKVEAMAAD